MKVGFTEVFPANLVLLTCVNYTMSFLNIDLEAQKDSIQTQDHDSQTSLIVKKASNLLTDFANGVNGLERVINLLGTKRDSTELRDSIEKDKIRELNEYRQQLEHLTNDISHLITNNKDSTGADKFSEEKLRTEFESINKNFNYLKRQFNERRDSIILANRINESELNSNPDETTPLIAGEQQQQQQQQQQQTYGIQQQELDLHALLAEEREADIKRIHGGVEEINTIYKHLGQLVQQQGNNVDTVENNLSNFESNAQSGAQELVKADNYQRSKGKWTCILLIILVIIVLIAVLAIFA